MEALLPIAGVRVGTAIAGIRYAGRTDVALFELVPGSACAARFTRNAFCAAPVQVARKHLARAMPRYLLINSGNANAGTGPGGVDAALATCAAVAAATGCARELVLPFSTGVIGEPLPAERLSAAVPAAVADLSETGWAAGSRAIMTTDTVPKARSMTRSDLGVRVTGIAKGAGMICPDMATMLAFVATDAPLTPALTDLCLARAVAGSFNRITIDGDTSTNDAVVLVATGAAGDPPITVESDSRYGVVEALVGDLCRELAQAIVRDGEGATKFIAVTVAGGSSEAECLDVAYTVAHSPLVKTAFFASDANWGRILAAVGRAGLTGFAVDRVTLDLGGVRVVEGGARAAGYTDAAGQAVMAERDIEVRIGLGRGGYSTTVWTTDLSNEYVRINGAYRT